MRSRAPIFARIAIIIDILAIIVTCSRQEYAITIGACHLISVNAVNCSQYPSTVVDKFLKILFGRSFPRLAELCTFSKTKTVDGYVVLDYDKLIDFFNRCF